MEWIYRRGMQKRRSANLKKRQAATPPCPLISVGNITTGGTGKTPAVQWLALTLQHHGYIVGIASRGYGGSASEKGGLVSQGEKLLMNAAQAGDEAVLHARALQGAIVAVARDRHHAVELCVANGAQVVILDDGFQFWSLPRAFEIVLLDAKRPFGNGHLLPWGRMREEPEALTRANAIVLTRSDRATDEELTHAQELVGHFTAAPIFKASHAPRHLRDEKSGDSLPLSFLRRRDVKAFAALADNSQFYDSLKALGVGQIIRLKREQGDHYAWKQGDFTWFEDAPSINQHQKEVFDTLPVVTTEKDAVKLNPNWFAGPLLSLRVEMQIESEAELLKLILEAVE